MRLRRPCEHDRYDPHVTGYASPVCPGGEFLPEDALVVETDADGEWPKWLHKAAMEQTATEVVAALAASQVGESRKMNLRKACEHGRYEEHDNRDKDGWLCDPHPCPGGELITDDVLVGLVNQLATASRWSVDDVRRALLGALEFDALAASQVGEPG